MTIKLYPHNQETYNKIQQMWETTNRIAVIQATGTGKSFIILKCLFDLLNENKIVLAPTEYIFEQLVKNAKDEVEEFNNVQFITYTKLTYMTDIEIELLNPSLIVLDEFHRCGAEQWGRGVQYLLDTFPNAKVLGTSATPIRYLDNERDMSDELFDGNIAVNLSLAEAIVKDILPMPKYVSALYTFDEEIDNLKNKVINSHNNEEEKEELLEQINLMRNKLDKSKGIPNILKKYLTDNSGKFIVFCKNKEHLYEMKEVVVDWFKKTKLYDKIKTYTIYTGYENLNEEFQAFKNNNNDNLKLLFSIEMLNEGIHVDDITGVILLRPTVSPIIYYQQIGRAIDAGNKNEPLIFDFVNNFDNIGVRNFVKDLNNTREKEIRERKRYEKSEDIDIPEFVIYDEILEVKSLFNNIENDLHLRGNWDEWYEKLKEYYDKNGHGNVPQDNKLGKWVNHQRVNYKKGRISKERVKLLENINFQWNIQNDWYFYFNLLKKFKLKYNHVNISVNFIFEKYNLGKWVQWQRQMYKKNRLSIEKIKKLNQIGFLWDLNENKWLEMFNYLLQYKEEFNNTEVPIRYVNDKGIKLGNWINKQRMNYKKGNISNEKIKKLENIGYKWKINDEWYNYYSLLKKFKLENGHIDIPLTSIFKDFNLGSWVGRQRKNYKNNKLSNEKIKLLEDIGFKWSLR